jgi:hypothetical protein
MEHQVDLDQEMVEQEQQLQFQEHQQRTLVVAVVGQPQLLQKDLEDQAVVRAVE